MPQYTVLLFYKYTTIEIPKREMKLQKRKWEELGFKGRMIIAEEGVNATLEGESEKVEEYVEWMSHRPEFVYVHWKRGEGTGSSFPKASVKVRPEIVSLYLGEEDLDPNRVTGKYLTPDQLHDWIHSDKEFYIVDMRNDYEYKIGHFENSFLFKTMQNFRDLPKAIKEIEHLKDKTVVTVCTGGIRCEKASGYLVNNGFNEVYQLQGGIHSYLEKYPGDGYNGKLYVFDGRIAVGFNAPDPDKESIGKCDICSKPTETYADYYTLENKRMHGLLCEDCVENGAVNLDQMFPTMKKMRE
jgi:UPF0176 protein